LSLGGLSIRGLLGCNRIGGLLSRRSCSLLGNSLIGLLLGRGGGLLGSSLIGLLLGCCGGCGCIILVCVI
jgi:hypothetical protein